LDIQLIPAKFENRHIIQNLIQLYSHDFSEMTGEDVDDSGRFTYEYLDLYWVESERKPFLIRAGDHWAGFVLVRSEKQTNLESVHYIAEFFVLRKFRRKGIGRMAAFQAFDLFPGKWRVGELTENLPAQSFWRQVIGEYCSGNYQEIHPPEWDGPMQEFIVP
jgi:predicted acetyltransferase